MQNRMKNHPLTSEEVAALLGRAPVGILSVNGQDGYPYGVPVHFAYVGEMLYIHGLPKGQKLELLAANPKVCFTIYDMQGLMDADNPCGTNTRYESIIFTGDAAIVKDPAEKDKALRAIVEKYTPQHAQSPMPQKAVEGTAVVRITRESCTGKYYR